MTRYNIKIGFIIYGQKEFCNELDNPISQINEFINFVQTNSSFNIIPTIIYDTQLAVSEIDWWGEPYNCYFLTPWYIKTVPGRLSKIPNHVHANFLLWDYQSLNVCWNGGTWGSTYGFNLTPVVSVPLYNWDWCIPFGRFTTSGAQVLVHEFMHVLSIIICEDLGFGIDCIPSSDRCIERGFTTPDWYDCHQDTLAHITEEMYIAISDLHVCTTVSCTLGIL